MEAGWRFILGTLGCCPFSLQIDQVLYQRLRCVVLLEFNTNIEIIKNKRRSAKIELHQNFNRRCDAATIAALSAGCIVGAPATSSCSQLEHTPAPRVFSLQLYCTPLSRFIYSPLHNATAFPFLPIRNRILDLLLCFQKTD